MQIKCGNKSIDISGSWLKKREFVADLTKIGPRPTVNSCDLTSPQFPATLYNAMVKAWTVYPMRGFIWYQGCSNGGEPERYMTLHPLLIEDWRNKWNDHSMPFIFAQLAAFHKHSPKKPVTMEYLKSLAPNDRGFSRLREVQTATLKVPGTGMGVAIDIGDPSDIHPADKQTLSYRMAMEAKRLAYGYKGVTSGPMYKSMKIDGNKIIVSFTSTGSGLQVKGDKINCFAVAGKNGKFVWANAKLLNDNTVEVWADSIKAPVAVRYAWAPYPVDPNLYNKEGFPACPFRSDAPGHLLK